MLEKPNTKVRTILQKARGLIGLSSGELFKLVVGVSGGRDSVCLLDLLHALKEECALELVVCHVDHCLRAESSAEAEFVEKFCKSIGVTCFLYKAKPMPPNVNLESWAREIRYGFFAECLKETRGHFICTAHHSNDVVETLLFRLLSGRFSTNAYTITEIEPQRKLLRPMLAVSRKQVSDYCIAHNLTFVEDMSNVDTTRSRNWIRHELLPIIQNNFNPSVINGIFDAAIRLKFDEDFLESLARNEYEKIGNTLFVEQLENISEALAWRIVRLYILGKAGEVAKRLGYGDYQRVLKMLRNRRYDAEPEDIGQGISCYVRRSEGLVVICSKNKLQTEPGVKCKWLEVPGNILWDYGPSKLNISAEIISHPKISEVFLTQLSADEEISSCKRACFDLDEFASRQLTLRTRKDGDIVDVWRRGTRKLKKVMNEKGVPLLVRDTIPVIECSGKIAWVPGVCRSNIAPIGLNTKRILVLKST